MWLEAALIAFLSASVADTTTTIQALNARPGLAREGNPLLRPFVDHPVVFGVVKMGGATGLAAYLHHAQMHHRTLVTWVAVAATASTTAVAVHNTRLSRR